MRVTFLKFFLSLQDIWDSIKFTFEFVSKHPALITAYLVVSGFITFFVPELIDSVAWAIIFPFLMFAVLGYYTGQNPIRFAAGCYLLYKKIFMYTIGVCLLFFAFLYLNLLVMDYFTGDAAAFSGADSSGNPETQTSSGGDKSKSEGASAFWLFVIIFGDFIMPNLYTMYYTIIIMVFGVFNYGLKYTVTFVSRSIISLLPITTGCGLIHLFGVIYIERPYLYVTHPTLLMLADILISVLIFKMIGIPRKKREKQKEKSKKMVPATQL